MNTSATKGLLILEQDDFELVEGGTQTSKVIHMTHTVDTCRYSVVMFYTDTCRYCKTMKDHLCAFLGFQGIQICMVNVHAADSEALIQLSQKTTTPLTHVPYLVFYVDGVPFRKFEGDYVMDDLKKFMSDSLTEADKNTKPKEATDIPPYTTGKPNKSKVCYLTYQKAY